MCVHGQWLLSAGMGKGDGALTAARLSEAQTAPFWGKAVIITHICCVSWEVVVSLTWVEICFPLLLVRFT